MMSPGLKSHISMLLGKMNVTWLLLHPEPRWIVKVLSLADIRSTSAQALRCRKGISLAVSDNCVRKVKHFLRRFRIAGPFSSNTSLYQRRIGSIETHSCIKDRFKIIDLEMGTSIHYKITIWPSGNQNSSFCSRDIKLLIKILIR